MSLKSFIGDRLRSLRDPHYYAKQSMFRQVEDLVRVERNRAAYEAAEWNRTNSNWVITNEDVNCILKRELSRMRYRSRSLLRDNDYAVSAMNALTGYCVGTGIMQMSMIGDKVITKDDDGNPFVDIIENEEMNAAVDSNWDLSMSNCDLSAAENSPGSFTEMDELVLRKFIEDGETFVHAPITDDNPYVPIMMEIFEPEALDENRSGSTGGNSIVMGVELDSRTRRPVAYWIKDGTKTGHRIDAKNMFHIFKKQRPGQVRGIPAMHAVTKKMFMLNEYTNAELLGVKIAACMSMFIERAPGVGPDGDLMPGTGDSNAVDANGNKITHLQPGVIGSVANGSSIHVVQPQKPGATYGMFTEHMERGIGAGIEGGLSFEALTRNTSKASYAGGRLATQADYQAYRKLIKFTIDKFNRPFRNRWMDVAVMSGAIVAPGYDTPAFRGQKNNGRNREYYRRHEWLPPAWQYGVNPVDDVTASQNAMRAGLSDLSIESGFLGRNWETTLRMQARIKKRAKAMGLTLTSDGSISIQNGTQDNKTDEAGDKAANESAKEEKS